MILKKSTDDNWEGFQKVEEHNDLDLASTQLNNNIQNEHMINSHQEKNKTNKIKERDSSHSKIKVKQKLITMLPEITGDNLNNRFSNVNDDSPTNKAKGNQSVSPTKKSVFESRIPRVPIIRHEQECRFTSKIVYKGFAPRSSDSYVRTLKDVNFETRLQQLKFSNTSKDVEFNSKFEGGNLNMVYEYDLYMRVDTNTRGHRQWFYFSIKSKSKRIVKLNIYRFRKAYSLFQRGMKPYVRSIKMKEQWKPGGTNIKYIQQKQSTQYGVKKGSSYYYLSFQYKFQQDQDQVFFVAGIPYTYTFLQQRILQFQQRSEKLNHLKIQNLVAGKSMCGLDVRILKIQHLQTYQSGPAKKRLIAINARTHSGQASSSWVLDGILDFITKDPANVQWMNHFNVCFYIIPMLNVDGVLMGNYRTGIVGDDFNRKFHSGRKQLFPEIYYLKKMISNAKKQGNLLMFMDLHGHSILKNSFIYGPSQSDFQLCLLKKLPFYLWHKSKYFKMSSCKFKTSVQKIETARMYFQIKQNILSFTCENSLGLYGVNQQSFQMTKQDWQKFGAGIVEAIKATMQTEKQVIQQSYDEKQDLRLINTPPLKSQMKPLTAPKVQNSKISLKNKEELMTGNSYYEGSVHKKIPNTSKAPSKVEKRQESKYQGVFFNQQQKQTSQKGIFLEQSVDLKTKISQIRQRFPSLTSKQLRNKEFISNQLKNSHKQERSKIHSKIQRNPTEGIRRKSKLGELKYTHSQIQQPQLNTTLMLQPSPPLEKNDKKEFLQSIYHRKQLKDLKLKKNLEFLQLGKDLASVQDIKQKIDQKKKKICADHHKRNIHKHPKKYSCDLSSDKQIQGNFEDFAIQLQDIRVQRSITYDQSYLASQIQKVRQIQQTERQYCDENKITGWKQAQQPVYDDKFSQNFDDSVNDEDSGSEDLPQQDKKQVIEYIRSHQNARRQKMFNFSQSQEQKNENQKLEQVEIERSLNIFNQKKRIHGFRQIKFKSVCNQHQQKSSIYDLSAKQTNAYVTNTKVKKNPQKYKQSLGIIKYKSMSRKIEPQDKDQETEIYITHKKKLNQRSLRKQTRKDPFILVSIKQKCAANIY